MGASGPDRSPLVIAASINGERTKAENPHVPRSHDEIVETALDCYAAGAGVLHAHNASVRLTGPEAADDYLAAWRRVRAAKPDAVWYPTLTLAGGDELEHVWRIDDAIGLDFACVDPGAVGVAHLDEQGLPSDGFYYQTAFEAIRTVIGQHRAGRLPAGSVVNFYFGGDHGPFGERSLSFGLPPTRTALDAYLEMLGDAGLPWTVSCWGGDILATELPALAIARGGHVQVGLESHFDPRRKPTNQEQIREVARLAAEAGRPLADCRTTLAAWRAPKAAALA